MKKKVSRGEVKVEWMFAGEEQGNIVRNKNGIDWLNRTNVCFNHTKTELEDIVSSRVKAQMLRLLFGSGERRVHLRELARQSGLSLGTVQQELGRLEEAQLVIGERDGNRLYFEANRKHPVYTELKSLVTKTNGEAGVLSKVLKKGEVDVAFIFGSVAKGDAGVESDLDLMVIGALGLRRLTMLLSDIAVKIGREINPHVFSPEEFRERIRKKDHFVTSVLREPKVFIIGSEDELRAMAK